MTDEIRDLKEEMRVYEAQIVAHYTGRKELSKDELDAANFHWSDLARSIIMAQDRRIMELESELRDAKDSCA